MPIRQWLLAGLVSAGLIAATIVQAQISDPDVGVEPNVPVLIIANRLNYDRDEAVVIASGNVEVSQGNRILKADRVSYNQRTRIVVAEGNVSLIQPDGTVAFADRIEIKDDLKDGIIRRFGLLFPDRTRVAASSAQRIGGERTIMNQTVFSPCYLCEADPTRAPLWQLRARQVIHDQTSRDIIYHDARMEIYGVPVIYTPYFRHPDPTVRRRSGFLAPTFGSDSQLGTFVRTPYFWAIGPDKDMTITPLTTTQERAALFLEYRQRLENGEFMTQGSYTYVHRRGVNGARIGGNESRGHFFTRGRFDIDNHWRWGFDGEWASDDTYLRRYDVTSTDVLITTPFVEGFYGRNYYQARGYHFQGLRIDDKYRQSPIVFPFAEMQLFGQPMRNLGRWHFEANILNLGRLEGTDSRRLSATAGWRLPYTHPLGFRIIVEANLNTDLYLVNDVPRQGQSSLSSFEGRFYPQAKVEARYPFARELGNVRHIVEPRVAVIFAPSGLNTSDIPNEDSIDLELDTSNLFALNRFPGRDRIDDGVRVVYGIENRFLGNRGGRTDIFIGQSYRVTGNAPFVAGSGLDSDLSDVVGRIRIAPVNYVSLLYRFRLKPQTANFRRNELQFSLGAPVFRVSGSYVFFNEASALGQFPNREEFTGAVTSQITENWSVLASGRWDLSRGGGILNFAFGAIFRNECCTIRAIFNRSFTRDRDLRASTSFLVQVSFKHLGEIGSQ